MNLLKYFFGILLVQVLAYFLILLTPDELNFVAFLRLTLPLLFIAIIVAFWFNSIAGHHSKDAIVKVKDDFANERDKLRVNAQRAKERVMKTAQKDIAKETAKAHAKANFKIGAAFAGLLGVGALFIFAQMLTAGLLAISATIGAMGGYYWRGKRMENKNVNQIASNSNFKVIESKSPQLKRKKT